MKLDENVTNEIATPLNWGFGKSKNKGTHLFWMEFKFPELVASNDDNIVTITKDWYLTPKTLDYVLRDLALLGWNGQDMIELDRDNGGTHNFLGVQVLITTKAEPWTNDKGEVKNIIKVEYINDPSYSPRKKMAAPEVKTMAASIRGKIAAYRSKNPAAKPRVSTGPVFEDPNEQGSNVGAPPSSQSKEEFAQETESFLAGTK